MKKIYNISKRSLVVLWILGIAVWFVLVLVGSSQDVRIPGGYLIPGLLLGYTIGWSRHSTKDKLVSFGQNHDKAEKESRNITALRILQWTLYVSALFGAIFSWPFGLVLLVVAIALNVYNRRKLRSRIISLIIESTEKDSPKIKQEFQERGL